MPTPVDILSCRLHVVQACDVIGFDVAKSLMTATCVSWRSIDNQTKIILITATFYKLGWEKAWRIGQKIKW